MSPWQRLVAFVSEREDATSLALCRILVGLTVLGHVVHFVASGAAALALTHLDHGGLGTSHGWLEPVGGATTTNVVALCTLVAVAAALVVVGLFTRPALVVLWLSYRAMSMLNADARGAYDSLVVDSLFLLMLAGSGRALSLDALWWGRKVAGFSQVTRWPRVLVVIQLGFLYSGSALLKASSGWVPGGDATALWYILHQPMWARGDVDAVPMWALPLTQVATTLVWLWELAGVVFVASVLLRESDSPSTRAGAFAKRVLDRVRFRELYLAFGVAMHLGIEVTMEVGAFSFASLALYPCALSPEAWRKLAARFRRRTELSTSS